METAGGTTRLISTEISDEVLKADLERYRQKALELGVAQAEVIPAQWVQVDERVTLNPRGHSQGKGIAAHSKSTTSRYSILIGTP